jgi:UDP-GlcNAc:undecaprenyl-phosphate/decaprenyl-phosphate GlcNAc-1-phosphate transferase
LRTFIWLTEAFGLALTLVLLVTPLVIRSAGALKLYDAPDGDRRVHKDPIPRLGGVAVFLCAAAVACLLFIRTSPRFTTPGPQGDAEIRFLAGAFIGSAILFLTGLVDDIRGLSPGVKLVAQIAAALVAVWFGAQIDSIALGYGVGVPLGWVGVPLVVLWIVGVTNVFNFIDGLNGLAGGIAVVACATIITAGAILGNFAILLPTVALMGALIGFLRYNFPRAEIFLGDSGSLSIGFLLAVLSLHASVNASGATLVILPLVALFVPLMDGALAIIRRWLRHVPISGADARHIHHRLLALGISPQRTAVVLWGLAAGMAAFGLLIALTAPFVATSIAIFGLVGVAVMLIYGTNLLSYHELMVAGEVLVSAPSRARRVISDQIMAMDVTAQIHKADTVPQVCEILRNAAAEFGFLGMELTGEDINADKMADRILTANWAWKLDYPIRVAGDTRSVSHVLSIWCSADQSARPFGAERVARVVGPAVQTWFELRLQAEDGGIALRPRRSGAIFHRRLRIK